jgi:hypothetical protein
MFMAGHVRQFLRIVVPSWLLPLAIGAVWMMGKVAVFRVRHAWFSMALGALVIKLILMNRKQLFGRKRMNF